jgi:hypothetical protein
MRTQRATIGAYTLVPSEYSSGTRGYRAGSVVEGIAGRLISSSSVAPLSPINRVYRVETSEHR